MKAGRRTRQHGGQAMVEYLIIFPTLLMLVLGILQFGLIYQIKSQVNYATFAAARNGAFKNANTTAIKDAFGAGMTPLFTPTATFSGMLRGRAVGAIEAFNPIVTTLVVVNPTSDVKKDAFVTLDPTNSAYKIVPNDNLQYRDPATGANSKLSVQDANILKIRITYCAKLIVPIANKVIYSVLNAIDGSKALIAGELYGGTSANVAANPNVCTQLQQGKYAVAVDKLSDASSFITGNDPETGQGDFDFIKDALATVQSTLDSTAVPGLGWTLGGYRIPVTSEAVVRMQSPLRWSAN